MGFENARLWRDSRLVLPLPGRLSNLPRASSELSSRPIDAHVVYADVVLMLSPWCGAGAGGGGGEIMATLRRACSPRGVSTPLCGAGCGAAAVLIHGGVIGLDSESACASPLVAADCGGGLLAGGAAAGVTCLKIDARRAEPSGDIGIACRLGVSGTGVAHSIDCGGPLPGVANTSWSDGAAHAGDASRCCRGCAGCLPSSSPDRRCSRARVRPPPLAPCAAASLEPELLSWLCGALPGTGGGQPCLAFGRRTSSCRGVPGSSLLRCSASARNAASGVLSVAAATVGGLPADGRSESACETGSRAGCAAGIAAAGDPVRSTASGVTGWKVCRSSGSCSGVTVNLI
jgi:hypothetical protein